MARTRHSKKDIEKALKAVEAAGWTVTPTASGHRWGVAACGRGCTISIWSTPRSPQNHAKRLTRAVANCEHDLTTDDDTEED